MELFWGGGSNTHLPLPHIYPPTIHQPSRPCPGLCLQAFHFEPSLLAHALHLHPHLENFLPQPCRVPCSCPAGSRLLKLNTANMSPLATLLWAGSILDSLYGSLSQDNRQPIRHIITHHWHNSRTFPFILLAAFLLWHLTGAVTVQLVSKDTRSVKSERNFDLSQGHQRSLVGSGGSSGRFICPSSGTVSVVVFSGSTLPLAARFSCKCTISGTSQMPTTIHGLPKILTWIAGCKKVHFR